VIVIPTHMPMVRRDNPDMIYRTLPEKWDAVVEEIQERYEQGQAGARRHGFRLRIQS